MTVHTYLRTKDLAQAVNISVQQVRNYEASGFLPVVERSSSGYRRYTQQHLVALKTVRQLIGSYGWQWTQQIMQAVHAGKLADGLALIDQCHAELDKARGQLQQTRAALDILAAQLPPETIPRFSERMRVGAAARLIGVRVSTLRFWEQQGLLHPTREQGSKYRLYDEQQLRRLRFVQLLRQANYNFAAIHIILDELEAGRPQRALAAVEKRRSELASISWRCLQATAALHTYISEFLDGEDIML